MSPNLTASPTPAIRHDVSLLTAEDSYLFNEGSHYRMYEKMGAHACEIDGVQGTVFSVWAPNAREVSLIGSFNGWNNRAHPLYSRGNSGIWEGFLAGVGKGSLYKFHIESNHHGHRVDKADPIAILNEKPPRTASVVWDLDYTWNDGEWMQKRGQC